MLKVLKLTLPSVDAGELFLGGAVAAGTRSAGESKLKVPDAPSNGLLDIDPLDFDMLNDYNTISMFM